MHDDELDWTAGEVLSVAGFCRWARIGRSRAFEEIRVGRLRVRKCGRRTLIRLADARAWLAGLPER